MLKLYLIKLITNIVCILFYMHYKSKFSIPSQITNADFMAVSGKEDGE